ncbi:MAG: DUF2267 domain-containing protein [Balneolaceae bacterium]|nr:DUF2267 domain-containing protein [Balneolaceae bacterium]
MKLENDLILEKKYSVLEKMKIGIEKEQDWIIEIANKMGKPGRSELAYKVLFAVLHSIRDQLNLQQVFYLSSYLPISIRGIYFEGYDPENVKVIIYNNQLLISFRNRMGPCNSKYFEDYLDRCCKKKIKGKELMESIQEKLKPIEEVKPDLAFQAVMEVIYEKIPIEDLKVSHINNLMDQDAEFEIHD